MVGREDVVVGREGGGHWYAGGHDCWLIGRDMVVDIERWWLVGKEMVVCG